MKNVFKSILDKFFILISRKNIKKKRTFDLDREEKNTLFLSLVNFIILFFNILVSNIHALNTRDIAFFQRFDISMGFLNFILLFLFVIFISIYTQNKIRYLKKLVNLNDKDGIAKEFLTFFNVRIFTISFISILCIILADFVYDFSKFSNVSLVIKKEFVNITGFCFAMSGYIIIFNRELSNIRKKIKIEYISKTELDIYYNNRNLVQIILGLFYLFSSIYYILSYYQEYGSDVLILSQNDVILYFLLYFSFIVLIYSIISVILDSQNRDRYIKYVSKLNELEGGVDFENYKLYIHNFDDFALLITEYNELLNFVEKKDRERTKNLTDVYGSFDKIVDLFLIFKEDFSNQITLLNNMYSDISSLSSIFKSIDEKLQEQRIEFVSSIGSIIDSERGFTELILKLKNDMKSIQSRSEAIQSDSNYIYNMLLNIEDITNYFISIADKIKDASKMFFQINEFLNQINDISEKTNLLSVNASIEAARAGVAGEGFSVIANEVQSLSENTGYTIDNIYGVINNTRDIIDQSISIIDNSQKAIQNNKDNNLKAKTTMDAFERSMISIIKTMVDYYYNVESKNTEFRNFINKVETLGRYFDILNKNFREQNSHYSNINFRINTINDNNKKIAENLEDIFLELKKVSEKKDTFRDITN